jgi:hypothetical protein
VLQKQAAKVNAQVSEDASQHCSRALLPAERRDIEERVIFFKRF